MKLVETVKKAAQSAKKKKMSKQDEKLVKDHEEREKAEKGYDEDARRYGMKESAYDAKPKQKTDVDVSGRTDGKKNNYVYSMRGRRLGDSTPAHREFARIRIGDTELAKKEKEVDDRLKQKLKEENDDDLYTNKSPKEKNGDLLTKADGVFPGRHHVYWKGKKLNVRISNNEAGVRGGRGRGSNRGGGDHSIEWIKDNNVVHTKHVGTMIRAKDYITDMMRKKESTQMNSESFQINESKIGDKIISHPGVEYYGGKDDDHMIYLKRGYWHPGLQQTSFGNETSREAARELKDVRKMTPAEVDNHYSDWEESEREKVKASLKEEISAIVEAKKAKGTPKEQSNPCWTGYTQYGMKMKKGRSVPNCVKDK